MLSLPQLAAQLIGSSVRPLSNLTGSTLSRTEESRSELAAVFHQFVGETFYQLMLKSLHTMHDKPAYMHGGQAETLFQNQLDQEIAGRLAQSDVGPYSRDLYKVFQSQLKASGQSTNAPKQMINLIA